MNRTELTVSSIFAEQTPKRYHGQQSNKTTFPEKYPTVGILFFGCAYLHFCHSHHSESGHCWSVVSERSGIHFREVRLALRWSRQYHIGVCRLPRI